MLDGRLLLLYVFGFAAFGYLVEQWLGRSTRALAGIPEIELSV